MIQIESMECRFCGTKIDPSVKSVLERQATTKYDDCYYKCPKCQMGFSNQRTPSRRTAIYPEYSLNVPDEVRQGLSDILRTSLNVKNRGNKCEKFAFMTSEDAVTWTVFRYINSKDRLWHGFDLPESATKALLFWGSEWPIELDSTIRTQLLGIQNDMVGEDPNYLTEPDLIIVGPKRLVFVEVKYRENNSRQEDHVNFDKYIKKREHYFRVPSEDIKRAGWYELTRNWVIGRMLAEQMNLEFSLITLGREKCKSSASEFSGLIANSGSEFRFVQWTDLLGRIQAPFQPSWFTEYVNSRELAS